MINDTNGGLRSFFSLIGVMIIVAGQVYYIYGAVSVVKHYQVDSGSTDCLDDQMLTIINPIYVTKKRHGKLVDSKNEKIENSTSTVNNNINKKLLRGGLKPIKNRSNTLNRECQQQHNRISLRQSMPPKHLRKEKNFDANSPCIGGISMEHFGVQRNPLLKSHSSILTSRDTGNEVYIDWNPDLFYDCSETVETTENIFYDKKDLHAHSTTSRIIDQILRKVDNSTLPPSLAPPKRKADNCKNERFKKNNLRLASNKVQMTDLQSVTLKNVRNTNKNVVGVNNAEQQNPELRSFMENNGHDIDTDFDEANTRTRRWRVLRRTNYRRSLTLNGRIFYDANQLLIDKKYLPRHIVHIEQQNKMITN